MEEKELKTSLKQRIIIAVIAVVMVGSILASYAAIVINGSKGSSTADSGVSEEKIAQYSEEYTEKLAKFKEVSASDFKTFLPYKSEVKAYNETAANANGVQTRDLLAGTGRKLTEDDTDYLAYYIGWCADETIFDSSLDNISSPTAFDKALDASLGMIEGWNVGVIGMRLGGVREVTVPGELAYGSSMEICGGYDKPLKFLVMAVANEDPLKTAAAELDIAYLKLQYAYYGIDYEEVYGN
ncbi:FKBP-type peptidyl-prolyl cis-trans isomerase [Candidatus Saccharibacteria bacterium]|nr:FKBP-type peptidyl-prolyl cis-trans isomerase [Candidatus Saccharibacteria bacterium]